MDNSGVDAVLRNRRFGGYCDASSGMKSAAAAPPAKVVVDEAAMQQTRVETNEFYPDETSWFPVTISCVRIAVCFVSMMFTTFIWAMIMLVLLPWPYQRIRQGNIYGHVTGKMLMWLLGNPITIEGAEYSNERAIYISNHASPIDIFLVMWLTPTGTVGIAKKEIIYYPLFGQLYVLANHLRIDRSNPTAAIESMKEAAKVVVKNDLSLIIFPEGTRSKNGRLLPFKKGFVHLALQTRQPIVPIVLTGTHRAWRKGSLHIRPAPLTIKYLPPIRTDDWTADKIEDYVKLVHDVYTRNLPDSQKPSSASSEIVYSSCTTFGSYS